MNFMGLFFVGAGVFALCGAVFNWDFFMNHRKAEFLSSIAGRTGARVFYGLLGTGLSVFGVLVLLGIVEGGR